MNQVESDQSGDEEEVLAFPPEDKDILEEEDESASEDSFSVYEDALTAMEDEGPGGGMY